MKIIFVCLFLVSTAWSKYLDKGNLAFNAGEYKKAYQLYKRAYHNLENPTISQFNMANSLYKLGQVGRAISLYESVIRANPKFVRPYYNAGGVFFQIGAIGEALHLYHRAHQIEPEHLGVIKMIGECYLILKMRVPALEYFEKGRKLEPENSDWIFAMAEVYLGLEDYLSVEALLKESLEENDTKTELLRYLGDIQLALGKKDEAILVYTQSLQEDATQEFLYEQIAQLLEEKGQLFLAFIQLKKGIEVGVLGNEYRLEMGRILNQSGDYEGALNQYILAEKTGVVDARLYVMDFFQQLHTQNRTEWANALAPKAIAMYPNDIDMKNIVFWK